MQTSRQIPAVENHNEKLLADLGMQVSELSHNLRMVCERGLEQGRIPHLRNVINRAEAVADSVAEIPPKTYADAWFDVTVDGLQLSVEAYVRREDVYTDGSRIPAEIELHEVHHRGADVTDILSEDFNARIKSNIETQV